MGRLLTLGGGGVQYQTEFRTLVSAKLTVLDVSVILFTWIKQNCQQVKLCITLTQQSQHEYKKVQDNMNITWISRQKAL